MLVDVLGFGLVARQISVIVGRGSNVTVDRSAEGKSCKGDTYCGIGEGPASSFAWMARGRLTMGADGDVSSKKLKRLSPTLEGCSVSSSKSVTRGGAGDRPTSVSSSRWARGRFTTGEVSSTMSKML